MTVGMWFTHREGLNISLTKTFFVIWFSGGIQSKVILEFFSNINGSLKGRNYLGKLEENLPFNKVSISADL